MLASHVSKLPRWLRLRRRSRFTADIATADAQLHRGLVVVLCGAAEGWTPTSWPSYKPGRDAQEEELQEVEGEEKKEKRQTDSHAEEVLRQMRSRMHEPRKPARRHTKHLELRHPMRRTWRWQHCASRVAPTSWAFKRRRRDCIARGGLYHCWR